MPRRGWRILASVVASAWAAVYITFWYQRSGCFDLFDRVCNDSPIAWLERLVSLWWVRDYQTLVAALVALGGAWLGAAALNRQMQHAEAMEDARRKRRLDAARSVMPMALSKLSEYARRSGEVMRGLLERADVEVGPIPQLPSLPDEAIGALRELIEVLDRNDITYIGDLLAKIQVQNSRLQSVMDVLTGADPEMIITRNNLIEYAIDAADVSVMSGKLFDFARRKTERMPDPVTWDQIHTTLGSMRLYDPEFGETIARRKTKSAFVSGL